MYIKRTIENVVINESKNIPVVMVYGPRQVGKSCMLNYLKKQHKIIVNEMISLRNDKYKKLAINDPEQFLIDHPFPVVIDEIQLAPNLFSYISNIVDEQRLTNKKESNGMYFLTGSESIELIKNASETLAGRVSLLAMNSLSYKEINNQIQLPFLPDYNQLFKTPTKILTTESIYKNIFIGGYPEIISNPNIDIEIFFESYIKTYIQRDVTKIINIIDETKFRKFIETVAARTGQEYIVDELAKDNNIDNKTVEKWMSVIVNTNLVYLLQPFNNSNLKRIVKRSKIYFMDTGLACYLSYVNNSNSLERSNLSGAFFETYVVGQIIRSYANNGKNYKTRFYWLRNNSQKEIDFIIQGNNMYYPIEIKKTSSPKQIDISSGKLLKLLDINVGVNTIICNVDKVTHLSKDIIAVPFNGI